MVFIRVFIIDVEGVLYNVYKINRDKKAMTYTCQHFGECLYLKYYWCTHVIYNILCSNTLSRQIFVYIDFVYIDFV